MEFPKLTTIVLATALSCVPHTKPNTAITLPQATTRQAVQKTIEFGPGTCGLHGIRPKLCDEKGCRELPCK